MRGWAMVLAGAPNEMAAINKPHQGPRSKYPSVKSVDDTDLLRRLAAALAAAGYDTLDEQAKALGIHRSTAWTIVTSSRSVYPGIPRDDGRGAFTSRNTETRTSSVPAYQMRFFAK